MRWWLMIPCLGAGLLAQEVPVPGPSIANPVPGPAGLVADGGLMQPSMPKELNLENLGGVISGDPKVGICFDGPVKLTGDNGLEVFANRALVDVVAKKVTLSGDVAVYQGNLLQRGEETVYNYETRQLDTQRLRASVDALLLESGKFRMEQVDGQTIYTGTDAGVTTHDMREPNFWLRAKTTRIYPGEKVTFRDLHVYAGDVPVFWLPYLSQPMSGELGYHFIPGARSHVGPFLLNSYGIMLGGERDPVTGDARDAWLLSRWRLNLYGRRGAAVGLDLVDSRTDSRGDFSGFSSEYLNDMAPDLSRSGAPRSGVDAGRYRLQWRQRLEEPWKEANAEWRVDANLALLSDRHYLEDFDLDTYRQDPIPDQMVGLYRRSDTSLVSLLARMRLNDFFRGDTRSPEFSYDRARASLWGTPLQHEAQLSLGWVGERAPDLMASMVVDPIMGLASGDPASVALLGQLTGYERQVAEELLALPLGDPRREALRRQLLDSSYARLHAYQELSLPLTLGGCLSLVPKAGLGYTQYAAIDGPRSSTSRSILHVGTEASVKYSRDLVDWLDHDWGIDGIRHVVQPYIDWSVVSTQDVVPGDPMVDRLTPTTRPRPIHPLGFTAIDQMQSWNVMRTGARNRLFTRRDGGTHEWMFLDSYMDAFLEDPEGQRSFSNFHNDVRWHPVPWLQAGVQTQFPIVSDGSGFNEIASFTRYQASENLDLRIGYRWLNGHPVLIDSSRFDFQTYLRLSEHWGVGTMHVLEMEDGTVESQQYTVHRDLGNWIASFGINTRDNRFRAEYGFLISITLKDFPSVSLPFEMNTQ